MIQKTIFVLFGGLGSEIEVSINSGINCCLNLDQQKYKVVPLRLNTDKSWDLFQIKDFRVFGTQNGFLRKDFVEAELKNKSQKFEFWELFNNKSLLRQTLEPNFFLNLIHGEFGEDGQLQTLLKLTLIPFSGSSPEVMCLTMNKLWTQQILGTNEILTPKTVPINFEDKNSKLNSEQIVLITSKLKFPLVAKPNSDGSSIGLYFINSISELKNLEFESCNYLFQDRIVGVEYSVPVLVSTKNIVFSAIQIQATDNNFDYNAKYLSSKTQEICPAPITQELEDRLEKLALQCNLILGCRGITRTDMIHDPITDQIFVLEINTIPGMTKSSLIPKFCHLTGFSLSELLDQMIESALTKN